MATKKETKTVTKTTAKKQKPNTVTYKGQTFEVIDRTPEKVMLTDGLIHFWARAKDVAE